LLIDEVWQIVIDQHPTLRENVNWEFELLLTDLIAIDCFDSSS